MKYVLAVVLLMLSMAAMACGNKCLPDGNGATANASASAGAVALAGSLSSSSVVSNLSNNTSTNVGGSTSSINVEDRLQLPPAPSLSASSSNSTGKYRILKQRQVSFLLGGFTNVDMELDVVSLVEALQKEPNPRVELAACIESENFRKLRKAEGNACPDTSK